MFNWTALLSALPSRPKAPEVQDEAEKVKVFKIDTVGWAIAYITPAVLIGMTIHYEYSNKTSTKSRKKVPQRRKATGKK